ncbi:hypothetical protein GQ457_03G017620 [Hibiscus cannabinus]
MINQAELSRSSILTIRSCTEATWITKTQNLSRQSIGPDFPAPDDRQNTGRDINFISILFSISLFGVHIRKKAEIESKSKT